MNPEKESSTENIPEESSMTLRDQDGNEVFKVGAKGEIFWKTEDGKMVQAKTDDDLGKAIALTILQLAGMDYVRLIEVYLGESVQSYRTLLTKKIMESNAKSKNIKKSDLVKIINEFKL